MDQRGGKKAVKRQGDELVWGRGDEVGRILKGSHSPEKLL